MHNAVAPPGGAVCAGGAAGGDVSVWRGGTTGLGATVVVATAVTVVVSTGAAGTGLGCAGVSDVVVWDNVAVVEVAAIVEVATTGVLSFLLLSVEPIMPAMRSSRTTPPRTNGHFLRFFGGCCGAPGRCSPGIGPHRGPGCPVCPGRKPCEPGRRKPTRAQWRCLRGTYLATVVGAVRPQRCWRLGLPSDDGDVPRRVLR